MENLKKKKKVKVFFTMSEEVYNKLEEHINTEEINKSLLLEHLVEKYLEKINKK